MNERNSYFASVFSRELDRWKKENGSTQAVFSEITGIHPNSLSRYRKGEAYPTDPVMNEICAKLGVDKSIFYPQTFEDWFVSSEEFRRGVFADQEAKEIEALRNADIDILFWEFLWRKIPYTKMFMPIYESNNEDDLIFLKKIHDDLFKVFRQDIDFVHDLQNEVIEYISMVLIKKALQQRLEAASDEVPFIPILMEFSKDLILRNAKESANGND